MEDIKKEVISNSLLTKVTNLSPALIEDNVIKMFAKDKNSDNPNDLNEYNSFINERKGSLYSDIIYSLTALRFDEQQAFAKWNELLKHKYEISTKLGRNAGIKISALDYFYNITKELKDFAVVDAQNLVDEKIKTILDLQTGAYNKDFLINFMKEICERGKRKNFVFSLLFFDIDNYKKFNDTYGHILGDYLLISLVKFIKRDLTDSDFIFRFGGEEFVIFFGRLNIKDAYLKAENIRKKIAENDFREDAKSDKPLYITISGGLVSFPDSGVDPVDLLELADGYLYKAKRFGKNKILFQ